MPSSPASQADILNAVVDRLIEAIDDFSDANCFLCDQPIPRALPTGRIGCTVSMGGGQFPQEFFAGGGIDTLTESGSVIVTPIVVAKSDRPYRKTRKIVGGKDDSIINMLSLKQQILAALLGEDWEAPLGYLRDMISPISADDPHDVPIGETMATAMQIRFAIVFDWKLT
jgi:hypothetical protein